MTKFALKKIELISGVYDFFDLEIDGVGQLEEFEKDLQANYKGELIQIIQRMEHIANLNTLPDTKLKDITPRKEGIREYEFKTKHLRVYAIHLKKKGKVVVLCGYKNRQNKNIRSFRSLKDQFITAYKDEVK